MTIPLPPQAIRTDRSTNLKIAFSILGKGRQGVLFLMIRWIKWSELLPLKNCLQEIGHVQVCSATVFPAFCYLASFPPARDPIRQKCIGKDIPGRTVIRFPRDFKFFQLGLQLPELIQMNDIVAAFNEYFEVIDVDTPELLREAFRVRYQVLCVEQRAPGFPASRYPDKMESDDYDRHSSHILLRHCPSGAIVGTARLILADPLDPEKPFPTERYMTLNSDPVDIASIPRQNIGEISRLHITREFRRRKEDHEGSEAGVTFEENGIKMRRRFPHPILALAVGLIRISASHGITHWISIMDPALNRLLSAYGLQHDSIGPLTEYYGQRGPYYANLTHMLDRMNKKHKDIWELVTDYGRVIPKRQRDVISPAPHPSALANI